MPMFPGTQNRASVGMACDPASVLLLGSGFAAASIAVTRDRRVSARYTIKVIKEPLAKCPLHFAGELG